MAKPRATWNDETSSDPWLIWWAKLDDRYQVEVQRIDGDFGLLCIFDHKKKNKQLLAERVPLLYGSAYGPDVEDVAAWENRAAAFVDSLREKPEKKPRKRKRQ